MPKLVRELEELQRPLADRIFEFLQRDPAKAYTAVEIAASIEGGGDPSTVALMRLAFIVVNPSDREQAVRPYVEQLAEMVKAKMVRSFDDNGTIYFAVDR